ncbi:MAG TPA: hypothetical protein VES67_04870 [Vicinamibacterales bacterium]|nr:hypothetical protein [Vicinamibacterales bacterium]
MIRRVLLTAGALLALFHVWLFAGQAWDGQLADPALILRWLFAGALVGALAGLRRQGASIFRGRKAVAIWLLAALLHGPAAARGIEGLGEPALPEFVATFTQLLVASGAAFRLAWALGRTRVRRQIVPGGRSLRIAFNQSRIRPLSGYGLLQFAPRPPPQGN